MNEISNRSYESRNDTNINDDFGDPHIGSRLVLVAGDAPGKSTVYGVSIDINNGPAFRGNEPHPA